MEFMNGFMDVFIAIFIDLEFPNLANLTRLLYGCMHCTVCTAAQGCMHCYAGTRKHDGRSWANCHNKTM